VITASFSASDGADFSYLYWPAEEEKARLLVLHGMGSAACDFSILGENLAPLGIGVIAPNLRGNGLDPDVRRRGHSMDLIQLRRDFTDWMDALPVSEWPLFLAGESMGGLLAMVFLSDPKIASRFRGCILLCPVFELARNNHPWIVSCARLAARLFPRLVIPPSLFVTGKSSALPLTRDPEYQEYLRAAPHRIGSYTIQFTMGISELMAEAGKSARHLYLPLLHLVAGNDVFIRPDQAKIWFDQVASQDKTLRVFPEASHLLLHDWDSAEVLETIGQWLLERC